MTVRKIDDGYYEVVQGEKWWTSRDGKRNIVIISDELGCCGPAFAIRNLETGRANRIEIAGLVRKFRFVGYGPACDAS